MKTHFKFPSWFSAVVLVVTALVFVSPVYAMSPTLTLTSTGSGDGVQVNVSGDPNASVVLYYTKTNVGSQLQTIGTTGPNGILSTVINTSTYNIAAGSSVYVSTGGLNGLSSLSQTWPTTSASSGTLTLSQTSLVLPSGQSASINVQNNPVATVYLSNNSNPPVANINISGNQLTINALTNGSSTITVCSSQSSANNCASAYLTVQNGSALPLTFSMSNVTIAQGQSLPIAISGGNGNYQVLTNSNSTAVQSNISGGTVTLTANPGSNLSATSAITVCTSDNVSCGIINASVGSSSSLPLAFSPASPTLGVGQSLSVIISAGSAAGASFNLSSNSNSNVVSASVSGNNLNLNGISAGTSTITVCSSGGSCGSLTVTVNYISTGGALQLSQTTASLLVGQVISVSVTGGTAPYNVSGNNANYFQASINGNIVTLSGIAAGSSTLNVCSAMSACATLSVTVNASGAGTPLGFSQNNLSLNVGGATAVTMTGSGGYYVSSSSNQGVASAKLADPWLWSAHWPPAAPTSPFAKAGDSVQFCLSLLQVQDKLLVCRFSARSIQICPLARL